MIDLTCTWGLYRRPPITSSQFRRIIRILWGPSIVATTTMKMVVVKMTAIEQPVAIDVASFSLQFLKVKQTNKRPHLFGWAQFDGSKLSFINNNFGGHPVRGWKSPLVSSKGLLIGQHSRLIWGCIKQAENRRIALIKLYLKTLLDCLPCVALFSQVCVDNFVPVSIVAISVLSRPLYCFVFLASQPSSTTTWGLQSNLTPQSGKVSLSVFLFLSSWIPLGANNWHSHQFSTHKVTKYTWLMSHKFDISFH